MSEVLVKRARDVLNGVTPGPWRACETTIHGRKYGGCWVEGPEVDDDGRLSWLLIPISGSGGAKSYTTRLVETQGHDHNDENARFIAASRELVPAMADRIEELEAKLAKAVAALDKLARLGNGEKFGNSDGNMIARAALAEINGGGDT